MPPKPTPTPTIPASKEKAGHRREEATSNSPANALERKRSTPTFPEHTGQPAKRMRSNSEVDGRPNDEDVNFVNSFGVIQNQVNSLAEKVQQDLQRIAAMIAQGRAEEVAPFMEGILEVLFERGELGAGARNHGNGNQN